MRRSLRVRAAGIGRLPSTPCALVSTRGGDRHTAGYIAELVAELVIMARASRHELLAYFLTLAQLEAESIVRTCPDDGPRAAEP